MFFASVIPVVLYFLLEFSRRSPINEEQRNRGSSILIGAVLTWMVIIPTAVHFFVDVWSIGTYALDVGILISVLGLWVRWSAITMLGRFYSRNVGIQAQHELIQTGWYRYIRHPGYLGTCLTFLGFAVATGSWLSVLINSVLFMFAYSYRIKVEEMALVSQFGESYLRYKERTWRLIPFLY